MPKTKLNGEGSIRKRNDGLYEIRVSVGKEANCGSCKRISKYARTEEEAVRLLHELQYLKEQSPNYINKMTLGEWMDICLEVYLKNSLKQSTYNSYVCYIQKHFKPVLGNVLLSDLNPRMLQLFYNHKLEVEGLSRKTVINLNLFLHRVLNFTVGEGYIRTNPADSLNLSRGQKPEIEVLTWDEQAALIRNSYKHRYGVFVRLALFTGVRLGELLGLRWEDVDICGKMIHIRRTLSRLNKMKRPDDPAENTTEIVIGTPKSQNSIRSIPVIPGMLQELLGWKAVQERDREIAGDSYMSSGMVVTNELGGYIEPRTFRDYYEQILSISGVKHYTFHALRHTFATRAMEQGMDAKTLSVILGHYSVSFTMDTYTHVQDKHKIEAMSLMDELYQDAMTTKSYVYAVVLTMNPDSTVTLTVPDFPNIVIENIDFGCGVQLVKEKISEEVLTMFMPPVPTPGEQITLSAGQMIVQVAVGE